MQKLLTGLLLTIITILVGLHGLMFAFGQEEKEIFRADRPAHFSRTLLYWLADVEANTTITIQFDVTGGGGQRFYVMPYELFVSRLDVQQLRQVVLFSHQIGAEDDPSCVVRNNGKSGQCRYTISSSGRYVFWLDEVKNQQDFLLFRGNATSLTAKPTQPIVDVILPDIDRLAKRLESIEAKIVSLGATTQSIADRLAGIQEAVEDIKPVVTNLTSVTNTVTENLSHVTNNTNISLVLSFGLTLATASLLSYTIKILFKPQKAVRASRKDTRLSKWIPQD